MTRLARALWLSASFAAGSAAADPLTIEGAWLRATPPGARTAAAYLTIDNDGPEDRLLGGSTHAARAVEVHTQTADGGLQRMVHLSELEVPAGAQVRLTPGGLHLMLVDLAGPLVPGTSVALTLRFEGAGELVLDIPVVDAREAPSPASHTH